MFVVGSYPDKITQDMLLQESVRYIQYEKISMLHKFLSIILVFCKSNSFFWLYYFFCENSFLMVFGDFLSLVSDDFDFLFVVFLLFVILLVDCLVVITQMLFGGNNTNVFDVVFCCLFIHDLFIIIHYSCLMVFAASVVIYVKELRYSNSQRTLQNK